jgi:polar amino acid transport system permease protein
MESQISFFSSFALNDIFFMAEAAWRTLLISVISISIGTLLGSIFRLDAV